MNNASSSFQNIALPREKEERKNRIASTSLERSKKYLTMNKSGEKSKKKMSRSKGDIPDNELNKKGMESKHRNAFIYQSLGSQDSR